MSAAQPDVTVIVRECGERTADACVALLQRRFPGQDIHRVSDRPFSATLRRSLEKGLAEGRPWTLCIDADVLVLPELADLLEAANDAPAEVFELQGLVFDKLMTAPRAAGNHLYRTSLIARALPLIPAGHSLRPESDMVEAMAAQGFPNRQSATLIGLHDFEQSFRDLHAKAFLHGHKHRFLLPLYRPLWQMLAPIDDDFRVALAALDAAQAEDDAPSISRDFRAGSAEAAAARLALREKPVLDIVPDAATLRAWTGQAGFPGEARALSGQVASALRRGLFPEAPPAKVSPGETARPLVALACANAYPLFDFCVLPVGGGMETRAALFGRGLAALDRWQVCFVVSDFGQPFVTHREGIDFRIYQPSYRKAGRNVFPRLRKRRWFPVLNLDRRDLDLIWQMPLIAAWLALPALFFPRFWRRLKPAVVCCFGNNAQTAEVIADCHRTGIRTILFIAHDKDISPDYRPGNRAPNHYGMPKWKGHYALARADRIVVQTEAQREALRQHFGRDTVLIRNPVHVSPEDPKRWLPRAQREFVLWIGRANEYLKRPMIFVELARDCHNLDFVMIVSRTDEVVFRALEQACPPNLRILEHVPAHEIWDWQRRARVLVNTSKFEGFPNTFLQSAVTGVPIVSLEVDPDGMLARHGCGICAAGDARTMREAVVKLCADDAHAEALARAAHRHVLERHEAGARVAEFEACLRETAAAPAPAPLPWRTLLRRFVRSSAGRGGRDVD
ncbi:MAG: hypothetical protein CVU20_01560 [Betaproteobacteria bacterium HGW-Betaproteobacteria-14]|nr:MAG: hypothetical protein CVU20_01560 [Betaproteobacteria bacterium HGW-Betaproteobacteria-14]